MKITIISLDSIVGVGGIFRSVSMAGIDSTIHAMQFDTVRGEGHVEYRPDLNPRPENISISSIGPFQTFVDRWIAAAPPPPPPPTPEQLAEQARLASLNTAISGDAVIQTLKPMTAAQFDAWWDANVTTAAQAINVLKKLVKIIIRGL